MNLAVNWSLILVLLAVQSAFALKYPSTKTEDVTDNYHGTTVKDPYRWLENNESPDTKKWIEDENKVTFSYLDT
ncbi:hypothetical protein GUH71_19455, partial [Xanthomonas citri pv. citri]|nr:hypothetical protein [Xanthomonas citri pv. citri]